MSEELNFNLQKSRAAVYKGGVKNRKVINLYFEHNKIREKNDFSFLSK